MTKLSTHIPLSDVKKSKKLQGIKNSTLTGIGGYEVSNLTLADIINNSEKIFGLGDNYFGCMDDSRAGIISHEILSKIFSGESIEEISQYIIDNIKENDTFEYEPDYYGPVDVD